MSLARRIALICAGAPLACGLMIFLLWLVTRWAWLQAAGIYTLMFGCSMLFASALALGHYRSLAAAQPDYPRRLLRSSTIACASLLLANFAVAGGIIASVIAIETCYTVVVQNNGQQTLDDIRIVGGGCEQSLGSIPPGDETSESFWIQRDGQLEFLALSGSTRHAELIDSYVSSDMGGYVIVTINAEGTASFEKRDH